MNECNVDTYIYILIAIIGLCIELYLGKTKEIKANSILELIFNIIKRRK